MYVVERGALLALDERQPKMAVHSRAAAIEATLIQEAPFRFYRARKKPLSGLFRRLET
jgi:hypothetical protein